MGMAARDIFVAESIQSRAKRFEAAAWLFLITMSLGLGYALYMGTSFFSALRQAQYQYAELNHSDNAAGIAPFVNNVIATWPERLAAYPATWIELIAVVLAFVLGLSAFWVFRKLPKGELLLKVCAGSGLVRERVEKASELAKSATPLFVTDVGDEAGFSKRKNALFVPAGFTQKLYRKHLENAPQQLAFLIAHEKAHGVSSDNLLWSWGRSLSFLLTAMSAALIASPIMMASVALLPIERIRFLPFSLQLGLCWLFVSVLLAFIGVITHGALPNLAAAREFFADMVAAHTLGIGPRSLPYEGIGDVSRRGDMATGWNMTISPPDRWLHVRGIAPRTGALAASTVAIWCLIRTLILMVDPLALRGVVWLFDAAYLLEIAVMLLSLPQRRVDARGYGLLPWVATIMLMGLIALSFALIDDAYSSYGIVKIIRPAWLAAEIIPPFVTAIAILLWERATSVVHGDLEAIDRLPPRRIGVGPILQLVASVPAYVWSYATASVALSVWCATLASAMSEGFFYRQSFLFDAASMPICAAPALLAVRNFRMPSPSSAALEACCGVVTFTLSFYAMIIMYLVAAQAPPGISGAPFHYGVFAQTFLTPPAGVVEISQRVGGIFGAVLLASWEMRYRLQTHSSLFGALALWVTSYCRTGSGQREDR